MQPSSSGWISKPIKPVDLTSAIIFPSVRNDSEFMRRNISGIDFCSNLQLVYYNFTPLYEVYLSHLSMPLSQLIRFLWGAFVSIVSWCKIRMCPWLQIIHLIYSQRKVEDLDILLHTWFMDGFCQRNSTEFQNETKEDLRWGFSMIFTDTAECFLFT